MTDRRTPPAAHSERRSAPPSRRTHAPGQGRATPAERALRTRTGRAGVKPVAPPRRRSSRGHARRVDGPRFRLPRPARLLWGGVATVVLVAVLLLFVFPTRTYLDQRHQLGVAARQLKLLNAQNAELARRIDQLHTDAEIERLAREQYHLVRPGEQAFAILPSPSPTTTAPPPPPPRRPGHAGWWSRTWRALTSWL